MIVKVDEIGKMLAKRMKEMSLNARIISERTGIPQSTLSEFFRGISFKKCFNTLEKLADVLNLPSLTIVFKSHLTDEENNKLYNQPDMLDLNTLLPEHRKQVLKIVEKSNKQKREIEIKT
ncbi:MAG: helix-turn-helix transcriptional regulator, partial [Bacillota bacterium]|nr:helix-turn-helix transcriptional regulator [Bacillota bacterium]